jgi:hypothetical protein
VVAKIIREARISWQAGGDLGLKPSRLNERDRRALAAMNPRGPKC